MSKQEHISTVAARPVHASIYQALAAAQAEMGPVLKENVNPAFKSRYADLASVVAACLPALNAHGISVFQPMREIDGTRFVVTILAHESGETIENPVPLLVSKNDMQGLGSAMTYARRYGLMAMAGVAPEDDDGNAAAANPPPRQEQRQPPRDTGPTAADMAIKALSGADTLDRLAAIWGDLPRAVQGHQSVIDAKDAAKARLSQPANETTNDEGAQ